VLKTRKLYVRLFRKRTILNAIPIVVTISILCIIAFNLRHTNPTDDQSKSASVGTIRRLITPKGIRLQVPVKATNSASPPLNTGKAATPIAVASATTTSNSSSAATTKPPDGSCDVMRTAYWATLCAQYAADPPNTNTFQPAVAIMWPQQLTCTTNSITVDFSQLSLTRYYKTAGAGTAELQIHYSDGTSDPIEQLAFPAHNSVTIQSEIITGISHTFSFTSGDIPPNLSYDVQVFNSAASPSSDGWQPISANLIGNPSSLPCYQATSSYDPA
jgi:hypothetical protein